MRLMWAVTAVSTSSRRRENSLLVVQVAAVVSPLVIRYVIGGCRSSGIFLNGRRACFTLQSTDGAVEVQNLPEGDSQIQNTHTGDCAAHPTRRDDRLQTVDAGLVRRIEQKIVVAPIAQGKPQKSLRNPGHKRQHQPDLQAKDNVENGAEL